MLPARRMVNSVRRVITSRPHAATRDAAQQQVACVDLPPVGLVVGGWDLGEQHHVGQRLRGVVATSALLASARMALWKSIAS
jgi:hypothetical protein